MFEDLGMVEKWKIPKEVLIRYVLQSFYDLGNPSLILIQKNIEIANELTLYSEVLRIQSNPY